MYSLPKVIICGAFNITARIYLEKEVRGVYVDHTLSRQMSNSNTRAT